MNEGGFCFNSWRETASLYTREAASPRAAGGGCSEARLAQRSKSARIGGSPKRFSGTARVYCRKADTSLYTREALKFAMSYKWYAAIVMLSIHRQSLRLPDGRHLPLHKGGFKDHLKLTFYVIFENACFFVFLVLC